MDLEKTIRDTFNEVSEEYECSNEAYDKMWNNIEKKIKAEENKTWLKKFTNRINLPELIEFSLMAAILIVGIVLGSNSTMLMKKIEPKDDNNIMINTKNEKFALEKLLPSKVGKDLIYKSKGGDDFLLNITESKYEKNIDKKTISMNGFTENREKNFGAVYEVSRESIMLDVLNIDNSDICNSIIPKKIIIKTPLQLSNSWEQEFEYKGKKYIAKSHIKALMHMPSEQGETNGYKVETVVENIEEFKGDIYIENTLIFEGEGIVKFERGIKDGEKIKNSTGFNQVIVYGNEYKPKTINKEYVSYQSTKRFITRNSEILQEPSFSSNALNMVEKNTVVDIHAAARVNEQLWLKVKIPVYDIPSNDIGWIKESDTKPYDESKKSIMVNQVYIPAKTEIYEVYEFQEISSSTVTKLSYELRGSVSERKNGYYRISCPGGLEVWVKEKYVVYPKVSNEKLELYDLTLEESNALNNFIKNRDDEILRGLEPISIYKMYFALDLVHNYDAKYDMYKKDSDSMIPSREKYLSEVMDNEVTRENDIKFYDKLVKDTIALRENYLNDDEVLIEIVMDNSDYNRLGFRLVKNEKDIWKVSFMPLQ